MHHSVTPSSLKIQSEFLESALRLYFEHQAYSAALHLAGAAEELMGKLLREHGGMPYLDHLQQIFMDAWNEMISERPVATIDGKPMTAKSIADDLNSAKNHVKHSVAPATYDARVEACWMLWRAFSNYDGLRQAGMPVLVDDDLMDRLHDEVIEILLAGRNERLE